MSSECREMIEEHFVSLNFLRRSSNSGKFTRGSPFVVMVAGVLLQLPSGLANGGLLQFAAESTSDNEQQASTSYSSGFSTAQSLVEVAIGLTVGLFVSAAVVNGVLGGGRRRGTNLSSF